MDTNHKPAEARLSQTPPKLLFVFADDRFFWSHRLPVARAALRNGYEVIVATGGHSYAMQIEQEGFRLIPLTLVRKNRSPTKELRAIQQLRRIYRTERPDIVHQVSIKSVLYGSIARLGLNGFQGVNALTGLGFLVASSSFKARFLRALVWSAFRILLNRPNERVLVENQDDQNLVVTNFKIPGERVILTRGSGVDTDYFQSTPEPTGPPVVVLASRMLWIKGVKEFVEAAKQLRAEAKNPGARFVLAGDTDADSPSSVPRQQLLDWQSRGIVEWWGHQQDMPWVFRQATLVCLPSLGGEGVPKVLMEAAASGRAIVTTDVPGCREIVRDGVNGLIAEPGNAASLAKAVAQLLDHPATRQQMAARSREIAMNEFSQAAVVRQALELYAELLNPQLSPVQNKARAASQV